MEKTRCKPSSTGPDPGLVKRAGRTVQLERLKIKEEE
jgi:hypothetical protein